MRKLSNTAAKAAGMFGFLALTSTVAFGLPWDIDMADSQAVRAYERYMQVPVEGTIPQANVLSPGTYRAPLALDLEAFKTMKNPVEKTDATLETGKWAYETYCWACHNDGQKLGNVANFYPGIAILAGSQGRLSQMNDGWVYYTIRHGSASRIMPAYGPSMNDTEIWSLVHYLRTLPSSTYTPPAPPPEEEAPQ